MLASNRELADKLNELERHIGTHDKQIQAIFEAIRQLISPQKTPSRQIGFHPKHGHKKETKQRGPERMTPEQREEITRILQNGQALSGVGAHSFRASMTGVDETDGLS